MSERKVLNKYYPPDFDPSKIPRLRLAKTRQYTVRIMTPCNMKCNTCGDYIGKAKKFNARKETVESDTYLGLKIFRFYFKCPTCMAEITFKTDPQNCDYELEHGATRNFQALRLAEQQAEQEAKEKEEEEKLNPMKMLEKRTKASKREMEELEALEELRDINLRQVGVNYEDILEKKKLEEQELRKRQEDEDEAFVRSVFPKIETETGDVIKTLPDASSSEDEEIVPKSGVKFFGHQSTQKSDLLVGNKSKMDDRPSLKRKISELIVVKKRKEEEIPVKSMINPPNACPVLCNYSGSDSESN